MDVTPRIQVDVIPVSRGQVEAGLEETFVFITGSESRAGNMGGLTKTAGR